MDRNDWCINVKMPTIADLCLFFAYAKSGFSNDTAHMYVYWQVLPPVRNSLDKKKKKRVKRTDDGTAGGSGKTKRISSYDYRAWDKFDVVSRFIIGVSFLGVH